MLRRSFAIASLQTYMAMAANPFDVSRIRGGRGISDSSSRSDPSFDDLPPLPIDRDLKKQLCDTEWDNCTKENWGIKDEFCEGNGHECNAYFCFCKGSDHRSSVFKTSCALCNTQRKLSKTK